MCGLPSLDDTPLSPAPFANDITPKEHRRHYYFPLSRRRPRLLRDPLPSTSRAPFLSPFTTRQSEKSQSEIELSLPIGQENLRGEMPRRDWLKSVTRVTPNFVSSFLALRSSVFALHHRTHPPTSRNHTKVQDVCHLRLHVPLRGRQGQDRARPQAVRTRAFSGHQTPSRFL